MNKDIYLTNSLGNKKELFVPIDKKNIGMYVCGPTVYDDPHIGNARPLVVFDILYRVLKCKYGKKNVSYVRNITDIDDKIIKASNEKNISIKELTENITNRFHDDCKYLNCDEPTNEPKATDNVSSMIEMIKSLIDKKFAYINNKHVYFEIKKYKDYGRLSNKKINELIAGSRVEVSENKLNNEDFVLWKPSTSNEPSWESPWGPGRPGWHLECSVMSKKYLGEKFDIHGGGRDLIFPHHENEIAQSVCANNTDGFANYWVHNGFITMSKEKMSKSQGNILKIKDFKNKINGQILRLSLLGTNYKQPLDWSDKLLEESEKTLNKWYQCYIKTSSQNLISENDLLPLYDDLNTPAYIANLHRLYDKAFNGNQSDKEVFTTACQFIGLLNIDAKDWKKFKKSLVKISEKEILFFIKAREIARSSKDFAKADKIRDELSDKGILIEDKDGKTSWKFK
ncbi:MAG: cysteine--tRNA ligase [Candidatus Pelagibacter sp. TMED275]|nr:MAG: cysteine--tRNA ligase [Candidatus Pelagibacter sp. TMED275]|tara:strand:- start:293 stop:1654 length:1362 start_codon:yes stop_codon:yes gene_type:complete